MLSLQESAIKFLAIDVAICERLKSFGFDPAVIYDIGASNGAWSWNIYQAFPNASYELFEPQALQNADYNAILQPILAARENFRLHTNLVSSEDSVANFQIIGKKGVGSSMLTFSESGLIQVPCKKLDTMIEAGEIPLPDIIKMDIQGAELMALKGGIERALPSASVLILELWLLRDYGPQTPLFGEVNEFLAEQGFFPFEFGDTYREENGSLVTIDCWYCRRGASISDAIWKGRMNFS